ncbi:MAG: lysophospholipid acyltransferase family protein [Fusobacterium sp.]|uniref:lysophospholipid acyltransferase family protein n=1 Tax=Fusobacterium sp. TaxID=68766 RepID=UPI0026DD0A92|nr:lysophospholipid acyltransferase family protein [Fusobacterium sp.]MDO4690269.1 lysophospholipid acyltransferase family protein [Fusobacterium sp.]
MEENRKYRFYGLILYYILKFLFFTLKVRVVNKANIDTNKAYIYAFWHNKLATPSIFFKGLEKKVALSSPTKDGELISVPLEKLGYTLVRGSSDKKSVSSTISLLKYLKKGYSMGTPLDGPKGPKEKAKKGLLYLAQKSSIPLVTFGVAYEKKWIFKKTWDKFEMPKPFSKICIFIGEEIKIGEDEDIDKLAEHIQGKINEANSLAEKYLEENNV